MEGVATSAGEAITTPMVGSSATSLLSLSTEGQTFIGSSLAFGEGEVKGRIKNVLRYRKPKFSLILFSTILVIILGMDLLFNPYNKSTDELEIGKYVEVESGISISASEINFHI